MKNLSGFNFLLRRRKPKIQEECGMERVYPSVVAVWLSGNDVGLINEVTLRRARLVLRWVTVRGYAVSVFNQATQVNSAWPSLRG